MPAIGKEDVKMAPFQDSWFPICSHDLTTGAAEDDWSMLAASGSRSFEMFMIDGRSHMSILCLSNVAGTIYVHQGVNPLRLGNEANADAYMTLPYVSVNIVRTWRVACRSKIARIVYVNGGTAQTVFEFSVELMNQ